MRLLKCVGFVGRSRCEANGSSRVRGQIADLIEVMIEYRIAKDGYKTTACLVGQAQVGFGRIVTVEAEVTIPKVA